MSEGHDCGVGSTGSGTVGQWDAMAVHTNGTSVAILEKKTKAVGGKPHSYGWLRNDRTHLQPGAGLDNSGDDIAAAMRHLAAGYEVPTLQQVNIDEAPRAGLLTCADSRALTAGGSIEGLCTADNYAAFVDHAGHYWAGYSPVRAMTFSEQVVDHLVRVVSESA